MRYIKYFKENFEWKQLNIEDIFDCIDYFDSYKDLYPGYSEDRDFTNEYMFDTKEKAILYANEILNIFNNFPPIVDVYRSIYAKNKSDIDLEYTGDHWSFDRESAINFAKNHAHGNYLLIGKIKAEDIDWKTSVKNFTRMSQNYDEYDENELVVNGFKVFNITIEDIKYKQFESVSQDELTPVNNVLKNIGMSISKMKSFQPSLNKIKRGVTSKDKYKVKYNLINTIFKNLVMCIYGKEFNIKKLRWIFINTSSQLGKSMKPNGVNTSSFYVYTEPTIDMDNLLLKIIEDIKLSGISISYDDFNEINHIEQLSDKLIINILEEYIKHYLQYNIGLFNMDSNELYKIIANNISNSTKTYSYINNMRKDKFLWRKLTPYVNADGVNNASGMSEMGFGDD